MGSGYKSGKRKKKLMDVVLYKQGVKLGRQLHKKYGKSYYFATYFFPKKLREATFVLYGFVRVPDEIVDNPAINESQKVEQTLTEWWQVWQKAWEANQTKDPLTYAQIVVFRHFKVPFSFLESFMRAMFQDLHKTRYTTYAELREYMYGSAGCVGLIMAYLIGYKNSTTLEYAKTLGEAFQVTNFLRDVGEDYAQRNRIYLPQEDLQQFHITEEDIKNGKVSDGWIAFMQFQIKRNRELYKIAEKGIAGLSQQGRFPVMLALVLYSRILDKIEQNKYDVFTMRAKTSFAEKIYLLVRTWFVYSFFSKMVTIKYTQTYDTK